MTRAFLTVRACVRACTIPGEHPPGGCIGDCGCGCHAAPLADCTVAGGCQHTVDPFCPGCKPRPALPGGQVCLTCYEATTAALDRLVDLYEALLTPTRVAVGTGRVSGSSERRLVLDDGPRWSREGIRVVLLHWRLVLALPVEPSRAEIDAYRRRLKDPGPPPPPLPEGPYGRGMPRPESADPHDTMPGILRHAEWLLAQPDHADQFVYDVLALTADATRTAFPAPPSGVLIGRCPLALDDGSPCDAPLRSSPGSTSVTCRRCGYSAGLYTWRRMLLTAETKAMRPGRDRDRVATGKALAAWLSAEYGRPISEATIRQWASAGLARLGRLPRAGRDPQGRTLYPIADATRFADRLYRPPAPPAQPSPPEETPDARVGRPDPDHDVAAPEGPGDDAAAARRPTQAG